MYLIVLVVCCCSGDSGFDGTVMGGINIMQQYQSYFGLTESGKAGELCVEPYLTVSGKKTSIVFGIYTMCVPPCDLPISARTLTTRLVVLSAVLFRPVRHLDFSVGEFLTYSALSSYHPGQVRSSVVYVVRQHLHHVRFTHALLTLSILIDPYQHRSNCDCECEGQVYVPGWSMAHWCRLVMCWCIRQIVPGRSRTSSKPRSIYGIPQFIVRSSSLPSVFSILCMGTSYYVGQMSASGMMVATVKYQNNWAWRLPIYIQVVPAAVNAIFILLCPETPRYLHSIGRTTEARALLAKYHSRTEDINSPLVELEVAEIEESIAVGGSDSGNISSFLSPSNRLFFQKHGGRSDLFSGDAVIEGGCTWSL